ncbi:MAG: toll/interleukin-1 receptor domain-containing protein [Nitrospiraceae bacterium]|nr:MAG: toll/interleukin-1 receptor domain-containing protein [Nitrospiraceae bacterium]
MAEIFISYRHDDSEGWAGRLSEALQRAYGEKAVFFDLDSIAAAENWKHRIDECLENSKIMIVMIGPKWLTISDSSGRRRLDDPDDIVRQEIIAAISRHIPILTLLVGNATLPKPDDLPDALRNILTYQAQELPTKRWKREIESLLLEVGKIIGQKPEVDKATSTIKVGEEIILEDVSAGDIAGYKGREVPEGIHPVEVGKKAKIKKASLGDIVGIKITDRKERKQSGRLKKSKQ